MWTRPLASTAAVLEVSFDGGNTFRDVLDAGGTFVEGGYNRVISTDRGSPIAGRQAWSGNSAGFITTVVSMASIAFLEMEVSLAHGQRQQRLERRLACRHS